jgi:hypothetical protein
MFAQYSPAVAQRTCLARETRLSCGHTVEGGWRSRLVRAFRAKQVPRCRVRDARVIVKARLGYGDRVCHDKAASAFVTSPVIHAFSADAGQLTAFAMSWG